jgi:hypothetical protein
MNKPIAVGAVFTNRDHAEGAVDELWHSGFAKEDIGLAAPGHELAQATTRTEGEEEAAAKGAAKGAIAGGAVGALAGLAVSLIPGIGPVAAFGLLLGLGTGAAVGAFAGPFVAMGFSRQSAAKYESELRDGRCILVVRTTDPKRAEMILREHWPVYIEIAGPLLEVTDN